MERLVASYFSALSPRQREVFELVELRGLTTADVATRLGIEPTTVRVLLLRARRNSAVRRYAAVAVAASLCVVLARSWPTGDQARLPVTLRGAVVAADTISADDAPSSARTAPASSLRAHVAKQRSVRAPIATTGGAVTNPVRPQRLAVAVAERPRSIAAIRLQESPDTPLGSTVSADPMDRKRATIMRTANPAITVVWLQD